MNRRGHHGRVDANHALVIDALRKAGWWVRSLAPLGKGWPDALAVKHGRIELIEVKDGTKPASAQKLTEDEAKFHQQLASAGVRVRVIRSIEEAIRL